MAANGADSKGLHRRHSPPPAWLGRLWSQQRVPLPEDKLRWWSIHVQNFLATVRRHQWQGAVQDLVDRFLEEMRQATPAVAGWRQRQARQALEVFTRGIDHWHFPSGYRRACSPFFSPQDCCGACCCA